MSSIDILHYKDLLFFVLCNLNEYFGLELWVCWIFSDIDHWSQSYSILPPSPYQDKRFNTCSVRTVKENPDRDILLGEKLMIPFFSRNMQPWRAAHTTSQWFSGESLKLQPHSAIWKELKQSSTQSLISLGINHSPPVELKDVFKSLI